jgi:hypothetical protein
MSNNEDKKIIAGAIREYIHREGMSREQFSFKTKIPIGQVNKLLVGIFGEKTLAKAEAGTGKTFRSRSFIEEKSLPALGGYVRAEVEPYVGKYVFLRPAFQEKADSIFAFRMEIDWDIALPGLVIRQVTDAGSPQFGTICIPKTSVHLFVQSADTSTIRQLILSRLDYSFRMRGLMLTLGNLVATAYIPMALPVALLKKDEINESDLGRIEPGHAMYETYREELLAVPNDGYGRLVGVPQGTGSHRITPRK